MSMLVRVRVRVRVRARAVELVRARARAVLYMSYVYLYMVAVDLYLTPDHDPNHHGWTGPARRGGLGRRGAVTHIKNKCSSTPAPPQASPPTPLPPPPRPVRPPTPTGRRPSSTTVPAPACWRAAGPSHGSLKIAPLGDRWLQRTSPASRPGHPKKEPQREPQNMPKAASKASAREAPNEFGPRRASPLTKPCMTMNLATVLRFRDTDQGCQNPGCRGPDSIAILPMLPEVPAGTPSGDTFAVHFGSQELCLTCPHRLTRAPLFLHATKRPFSAPWAALACRGVAEAATDRKGSTPHRSDRPTSLFPRIPRSTYKSKAAV